MRMLKYLCLLMGAMAVLPQAAGCVPLDEQISTFIGDFARQVLAAAIL